MFLGIDIGTSATKTLVVHPRGKILASASAAYPCYHPRPLWSEQDPDDWWQAVVTTVRAAVKRAKLKPSDVKAIGLSGQMHGSVFLDRRGKVLRRALLWNDQRTAAECEEIERRAGGRERLIEWVANPALTGFTAPKILWLRNHEPRRFEKLAHVLLPKDDVRRRMTGDLATEVSDASGMLLLDVARRDWSSELLSALELDRSLLGQVYESEQVTGRLTKAAAAELGLTTDCAVVGGAGDCAAGAVGNGIVEAGLVSTSIGTSGVVFVHSDELRVDPRGRVHTFCHAVSGKWHMMGVTLSAGGSLDWFVERLCPAEAASARRGKRSAFDRLVREAEAVAPGSEGLFFLPYLSGERTPHADPLARGAFIGLTLAHGRGHLIRSVLEGVCYSLRESFEIFESLGVPLRQVRASGGGAKSRLWCEMQAACFGQKVATLNAEEGPAYGAALLAAVGGGAYRGIQEACAATVRVVSETPVARKTQAVYDRAFPVYERLYRSLKDDFERIASLGA